LADPIALPEADFVICESTYGDREHDSAPAELDHFLRIVHRACIEKKGKLIIPAFAVGRTQEVVYMLDQLAKKGRLPRIPVFVDSPLAVNATEIFINHPECFDQQLYEYMATDADPFGFNGLQYVRSAEASKGINSINGPAIVIASSGMMNAGRIRHHLFNNIENPRNTFLIVGYCSPDTPGGELRAGATFLNIFGENKQVLAEIEIMDSFSAHGDRLEMFEVLKPNLKSARQIFLVHGTLDRMEKWRDFLLEKGFPSVEAPELGAEIEI
jgi:metallo-beta-lactamase family protein